MQANDKSRTGGRGARAFRLGVVGAGAGAACAAVYGGLFGEAEIQLAGAEWRLLSFVMYFAVCGLIAGALLGAAAGILNGDLAQSARRFLGRGGQPPDGRHNDAMVSK